MGLTVPKPRASLAQGVKIIGEYPYMQENSDNLQVYGRPYFNTLSKEIEIRGGEK